MGWGWGERDYVAVVSTGGWLGWEEGGSDCCRLPFKKGVHSTGLLLVIIIRNETRRLRMYVTTTECKWSRYESTF